MAPPPPNPPSSQPLPSLDQLLLTLRQTHGLYAKPSYLRTLLDAIPNPNPATLHLTLRARLLAADITQALLPHSNLCLPLALPTTPQLPHAVVVQVVDILDITLSRFESLEALEMRERGEQKGGRWEIVRSVPTEEEEQRQETVKKGGMVKVLLEDASGRRCWGVEVEDVGLGKVQIGGKVRLAAGTEVARGVVLVGRGCEVLGGRVEGMQREWVKGRKERLKREVAELKREQAEGR